MKTKRAYIAMVLKKDLQIQIMGLDRAMPLDFADGMLGMMPVFDSVENARKYTDGEISICEILGE